MNPPPPLPHAETPRERNSGLATCSLVFGIIGIFTAGILSIPAVITGHLALGKIKRSAGTLSGRGFAIAGLVTGYLGLALMPILLVAGFAGGRAAMKKARDVSAMATAVSIETAIEQFYVEHSSMPTAAGVSDTAVDVSLIRTLTGDDKILNPRQIRFLAVRETTAKRDGLDPVTHQLFDPWGNGYQVITDAHSSGTIVVTRGGKSETITGHRAVVYSLGADGIAGTADDVTTW